MALHASIALIFDDYPGLARLHAFVTFAFGLRVALLGTRAISVIYVSAYLVGCEVLWRMASAPLPWEYCKYSVSILLVLALLRFFPRRSGLLLPLLFLCVLVPSVILAFSQGGIGFNLRDALSFNLSGPISLATAVMFFRQVRVAPSEATNILWAVSIPGCGIATRTLHSILTADRITFADDANFATSGGFGPNQVSAALGLAALAAILLAFRERRFFLKAIAAGLALWFTSHSFLTFSRGGIYNLVIAGALAGLVFARARGRRVGPLAGALLLVGVMGWLILPHLEEFTEHRLQVRFTSLDTTQREDLASAEIRIWAESPLTGVGPGGIAVARERTGGESVAAHTEMTRLLAEHGVGGIMALLILVFLIRAGWRSSRSPIQRAWMVAFATWSLVEMSHSAMRIAAVGFCFGLAFLTIRIDDEATQPSGA